MFYPEPSYQETEVFIQPEIFLSWTIYLLYKTIDKAKLFEKNFILGKDMELNHLMQAAPSTILLV